MKMISFDGIGTVWNISIDGKEIDEATKQMLCGFVASFEKRYSRFLPESEVNSFREKPAGSYPVSHDFSRMLARAEMLRELTDGRFDPAVATLLDRAGYDAVYSFVEREGIDAISFPKWSYADGIVSIDGPIAFDFGGIGKGYCIDRVADLLRTDGFEYFLVEAGGDMLATMKADGSPYRVAIEYPGQPEEAIGVIELKHQALAVSDSFRRRWGKWHHIVNPLTKASVEEVLGCAVVAGSAFDADSGTSALFLSVDSDRKEIEKILGIEYLLFESSGNFLSSTHWPGEIFE